MLSNVFYFRNFMLKYCTVIWIAQAHRECANMLCLLLNLKKRNAPTNIINLLNSIRSKNFKAIRYYLGGKEWTQIQIAYIVQISQHLFSNHTTIVWLYDFRLKLTTQKWNLSHFFTPIALKRNDSCYITNNRIIHH